MTLLSEPLARSPELFPHGLDVGADSVRLIRLTEADYARASFLDERILRPGVPTRPVPFLELQTAIAEAALSEGCDFIFHISHVGSTLLSRLLGRHPGIFGLREPATLRTLVQMRVEPETLPRRWSEADFDARLSLLLKLCSRTFRPGQIAVVKATSFVSELASEILARAWRPKAICMLVKPDTFLATILGAENSPKDIQMLARMRTKRIQSRIEDAVENPASIGELVAMSWACEMTALTAALPASREQILWLDFDRFLADPQNALTGCFRHLGAAAEDEQVREILAGPDMRRYSKAPEYDYDSGLREQILAQARAMHAAEIKRGLEWLEKMAAKHPLIMEATNIGRVS